MSSSKAPRLSSLKKGKRGAFVLCVLDPYQTSAGPYDFRKDTSHLILQELQRRGHTIHYADPSSFFVEKLSGKRTLFVRAWVVDVLEKEPYFIFKQEDVLDAEGFSLILMRKDPPVDTAYLAATHLLSLVEKKVPVLNPLSILRDWNEKLAILDFPGWIPPTLVASDRKKIDDFLRSYGNTAILKSLSSFGGKGVQKIFRDDPHYLTILEDMTEEGRLPIMVQAYLPQISEGEKRVFFIDGKVLGVILKIPATNHFLANPDHGAHLAPTKLTSREKKLCDVLAKAFKERDVFFAGVDLIGGLLTEINVTSPGLVWEWNAVENQRHEEEIVDRLEKRMRRQ